MHDAVLSTAVRDLQEFACFVVDVGPHMHPLLPAVRDFLVSSIESKASALLA